MPIPLETLVAETRARQPEAERLLEAFVNQPSGSRNAEGVARMVAAMGDVLSAMGFRIEEHREGGEARHLVAKRVGLPGASPSGKPVLLIGHADTVFPESDRRRYSLGADGEKIHGPGCADMKGGLVVMLEALRVLGAGEALTGPVEVIVNGDEELGSPRSRELIHDRARAARAALVFENCDEEDGVIVGRKGLGRATVKIRGRAAHAGVSPEKGASAVIEMAQQIIEVARLDDPAKGCGVVIGIARGGISRNTVPPEAEYEIDLRFNERAAGVRAFEAIQGIATRTRLPGTLSVFSGELHRPPMPAATAPGDLLARAQRITAGRPVRPITSGGGSDANLTAGLGVPTLDGLGVVGGAIHTTDEWCLRRSLADRAALAAALIQDLLQER